MAGGIGSAEILLIVGAVVVLFGATAIPKLARSLGKAKGEFKKGMDEAGTKKKEGSDESSTDGASEE